MSKSIISEAILHTRLQSDDFRDITKSISDVPNYIKDNLSHELRKYQVAALRQFMYTQEQEVADINFRHLLFHMATGSGKTLLMAAVILYMYQKHGYQNFLFFVNSEAIVKKTYDNLLNPNSTKYLFNKDGIVINGERITLEAVDEFPPFSDKNTIYIHLTTIQQLHLDLSEAKENAITYDTLSDFDIIMLGDEAHHYFATTKKGKKKLTKKEEKTKSWEETINKILNLRIKNRMFGFSATLNLDNELLFEKVKDKIVYQYDLKKFMEDKFSKNVVLLRTNEDDSKKMLQAVLLSQYRKYIAEDHGITLKPVIMFKANKINVSENAYQVLLDIIQNLTIEQLHQVIQDGKNLYENKNSVWNKMFSYYSKMDVSKVIEDLQWDFTEETILRVNSKEFLSEENALKLNTLEDEDNPIRAIFQIAKLNEGWDVLNLFDIVRISEGSSSTINTTDSEAQLIGRGARYYPFEYEGESSFTRRFDEIDTDLKLIETLHYHTINENSYIKNLHKSLDKADIEVMEDGYTKLEAKIKPAFKKTTLFKEGKIYINKTVPTTADDYYNLSKYGVFLPYEIPLDVMIEQKYGDSNNEVVSTINVYEKEWHVEKIYIQKAIQRNPFYRFNNLKKYVPAISSIDDFIESSNFLGDLILLVTLPMDRKWSDVTPLEKLKILDRFFTYAENKIRLNYKKEKGLPVFEGVAFNEKITDYYIHVNNVQSNNVQKINRVNMKDYEWYIFDHAIVNNLEAKLIDFIRRTVSRLKEKYNDVYLIRNERKVKVTEIDGTRGFMPDFLLYLKDENLTYQVFIEPKGSHLSKEDEWKQKFLMELSEREDVEILDENDEVKLIGIKFYSDDGKTNKEFREDFEQKLLS